MFTYRLTCPHCGCKHVEHRKTPYGRNIRRKICPECKRTRQMQANDGVILSRSGWDETAPNRCHTCKYWGAHTEDDTNDWYQACARGRISGISEELGTSQVYAYDTCDEYEKDEDLAEITDVLEQVGKCK